jgi:phosphoenolpyruvate carboxykinase (ATP)
LNTGLSGGPAGVGTRISIKHTRALLTAALDGTLHQAEFRVDPWFEFEIPLSCPGVPDDLLNPVTSWSDQDAYRKNIQELVDKFRQNMKKYEKSTPQDVLLAGPG